MTTMCECENQACPFHVGRGCDIPSAAKVRWHGVLTTMCQQCLDMAVQTGAGQLEILKPIVAAQSRLFDDLPSMRVNKAYDTYGASSDERPRLLGWRGYDSSGGPSTGVFLTPEKVRDEIMKRYPGVYVSMPRTARLFKKGAATGNETFDRVWSDFHGKMGAPENEDREFGDIWGEHDHKRQLLIALGKLNYMMEEGDGFEDWVGSGYAGRDGRPPAPQVADSRPCLSPALEGARHARGPSRCLCRFRRLVLCRAGASTHIRAGA